MKARGILTLAIVMAVFAPLSQASYVSEVTADNPVMWFEFETIEQSLNGTVDRVGGLVGYAIDGPTISADGAVGNCVSLNGSGAYILAAGAPDPSTFSVEVWGKAAASTGWQGALLSYRGGAQGYILYLHDDNQMDVFIGTGAMYVGTVTVTAPDEWHQYVLTFDDPSDTANFYIDGVNKLTKTQALDRNTTTGDILVGRDSSVFFNGLIDEYSVYDTALGEDRILAHFNAVPEPMTMAMLFIGGIGIAVRRVRK